MRSPGVQRVRPEDGERGYFSSDIPKAPLTYESFIFTRDASLIFTFDR